MLLTKKKKKRTSLYKVNVIFHLSFFFLNKHQCRLESITVSAKVKFLQPGTKQAE
jgi:hypothetical protein